nr:MAG: RNA-dependent RNA polymerase [Riboviria sp.]
MLRRAWESTSNPIAVLIDHSKFDSSVMKEHIKLEEKCYLSRFEDEDLRELLSHQYVNNCYSKGGIAYTCVARKMSGEYNTSLGDSIINYGVLREVFGDDAIYVINGDDSVVILDKAIFNESLVKDPSTWARFGFKSTVDVARSFEDIEFCQSRPVEVDGVWRMIRSPWRAIARSTFSVKRYRGIAWRRLLAAMADSEMACSDRVPMLQAWALRLRMASAGASPLEGEVSYRAKLEGKPTQGPISDSTRLSFAAAFGIEVQRQLAFERWCVEEPVTCLQVE